MTDTVLETKHTFIIVFNGTSIFLKRYTISIESLTQLIIKTKGLKKGQFFKKISFRRHKNFTTLKQK